MGKNQVKIAIGTDKGLKSDAIGFVSSAIIAVASTGPALVIATLIGVLVNFMGLSVPGMILLAAIPVFMMMLNFRELHSADPDCGTSFTWVAKSIGPKTGFLSGWCLFSCSIVIMPASAHVVSTYAFALFGADSLIHSRFAVVLLGIVFIGFVTWICYLGAEVVAWVQKILVTIELTLVIALLVSGFIHVANGDVLEGAVNFNASMFNPFTVGPAKLAGGFTIAIFAFWGWDLAFTLGEETKGGRNNPVKASIISLSCTVTLFCFASIMFLCYAGPDFMVEHYDTLMDAVGPMLLGTVAGKLLVLCTFTSILAATQATILPASRQLFAMSAFRALPDYFAHVNKHHSPSTSTVWIGIFSAVIYITFAVLSQNVMFDSQSATGMMVAFYYGMTALGCFFKFKNTRMQNLRNIIFQGIIPIVSAIIMFLAFILCAVQNFPAESSSGSILGIGNIFWLSVGTMVLGVIAMLILKPIQKEYFSGQTLKEREEEI